MKKRNSCHNKFQNPKLSNISKVWSGLIMMQNKYYDNYNDDKTSINKTKPTTENGLTIDIKSSNSG